ncbi:N-acylhomoserine lactone synthase [Methylomonas sp. Kb3]|uniref:acyl-homoserine-lactone synthase n=1 Tax=Methylomonas sp. Kb3 TaxID=1611544 RepID=UPI000C342ECE|nr:acyl-homoserine-lactone synthase [Methylomonas sp. Kb3]PKD38234.1 N-acylhomoserine lactone synthase [Methylomonas sp. Kb3]
MCVVKGRQEDLPAGLYSMVANYRHRVFVEQLGWQLQTFGNTEQDQFDRDDTIYVISRDKYGDITGCARLLPTTRPYLLGEVFPQLLNGMPVPNSPDVWELSRFASVDFNTKTSSAVGQFSSPITLSLLHESIAVAAENGAKRIITVSPVGIERLLHRTGLRAHRAGPPMIVDGHPIFACWIDISI